ncbi:hypothetical protein K7432_013723 [Basidiobolus ranarum]|uniref:Peroxisomal membrane protein PEX14 n=1 Tax=Basidiobolus ranarum TaxID=34480 RepID=A0ABR2VQD8_9FUNG
MSESGSSPIKPLEANHDSVKQSPHVEEKSKLVEGKFATSTEVPEGDVEQKPNSREELLSGQKLGRNIQNSPSEPILKTTANTTKITENSSQMSSLGEPSPKLPPIEPNTKNIEPSPRPQMIAQAVSFLNSANVQTAPLSKKLAFLKNKGLTQTEIDMAVKKASLENSNTGVSLALS